MAASCGSPTLADVDEVVELWVKAVVEFSSQYNTTSWAANNVIGEPLVYPRYGDINGAWAQGTMTANEFIVVEFADDLYFTGIEIYETLNAGAITRISAWDPSNNKWVTLWESPASQLIQHSRCFSPPITHVDFSSRRIKLELDCTTAGSWCEIDAIKIKGKQQIYAQPSSIVQLSESLRELVNCSLFSDVKFMVEGREIHAHRAILVVRSSYFRALLSNGMLESRQLESNEPIKMDDISFSGFIAMLHYIYTNTFDTSTSPLDMTELIRIGDRFSLNDMKVLSFHQLRKLITADNVVDVYCDAIQKLPHLEEVENICLRFISKNLSKITKLPSFCNLPQNLMLLIIQDATSKLCLGNN